MLKATYLVFLGATTNPPDAKTGRGLVDWRPDSCVGQLRLPGCTVDLGLPDMSPAEAVAAGAGSLVIGIASTGGRIAEDWLGVLKQSIDAGLDIVSGMRTRLSSVEVLRKGAEAADILIGTGNRRSGKRLLTVGTDCCVGKKYTALAIQAELAKRKIAATFPASGQTGIMIAGEGIPIDALVLCHDASRSHIDEYPLYPIPPLDACVDHYLRSFANSWVCLSWTHCKQVSET